MALRHGLRERLKKRDLQCVNKKILRRVYGPCIDSVTGERRIGYNDELKNLFQKPDIIVKIKRKRLMWAGNAWRKEGLNLLRGLLKKIC